MSSTAGRVFRFGDHIDTDVLAPGRYLKLGPEALAAHCLEAIDPHFAKNVRPGDFILAGNGFGIGSSREQAAESLQLLGVRAVLARSFSRIFWRNAINIGLPAVVFPRVGEIDQDERLQLDLAAGVVSSVVSGRRWPIEPLPGPLLAIIADGGLIAHLKAKRIAAGGAS